MYHWQTDSYARHKASDDCLTQLAPLIDKFMEIYQGKYGKIPKTSTPTSIPLSSLTDKQAIDFIKQSIKHLNSNEISLKLTDTDLLNIRDEMVGILNQTLYLFTFQ